MGLNELVERLASFDDQRAVVVLHERIHTGEKPFSCKFCDTPFTQLSNKKRHELLHTGEKPHICQFCNVKFTVQSNMKVHEKKCGLNPERKIMNKAAKNTGEKPNFCQFCNV